MRKIFIFCLLLILFGCGSDNVHNGNIVISCMDVDSSIIEKCDGKEVPLRVAMASNKASVPGFSFDSGDIPKRDAVIGVLEMDNNTVNAFNGVYITPLFVRGCGFRGYNIGPIYISPSSRKSVFYGGANCSTAEYGNNEYVTRIYKGVIDMDIFAPNWSTWDWEIVERDMIANGLTPFMEGTVKYNYIP